MKQSEQYHHTVSVADRTSSGRGGALTTFFYSSASFELSPSTDETQTQDTLISLRNFLLSLRLFVRTSRGRAHGCETRMSRQCSMFACERSLNTSQISPGEGVMKVGS